jgi:hypothetical protein
MTEQKAREAIVTWARNLLWLLCTSVRKKRHVESGMIVTKQAQRADFLNG